MKVCLEKTRNGSKVWQFLNGKSTPRITSTKRLTPELTTNNAIIT